MRSAPPRGFQLIELMIVVALIAAVSALGYSTMGRTKPKQRLTAFTVELRSILNGARQNAMASGHPVVVMLFPDQATGSGTGRVITYRDGNGTFFSAAAPVNFGGYDPTTTVADTLSEVLDVVDLPTGVRVGPVDGMGSAATLKAPFAGIAINTRCGFCSGTGGRGAVVFSPLGSVTFQAGNGPALALPVGASISLRGDDAELPTTSAAGAEVRTLAIASTSGALRTLHWKP